mgnify:CR=1 FL=1
MLLYVLHVDKPVHCIISVLYVTILIKREREKERKRNLASQCDRLQGASPPHPPSQGAIHPPTLTELSHTLACRHRRRGKPPAPPVQPQGLPPAEHPCILQRNCRTPQRNYATRWPAGVAFLLRAYCIPNECVLCANGKSVCKREIGDKTGNEAGGKPPAPPVQPRGRN